MWSVGGGVRWGVGGWGLLGCAAWGGFGCVVAGGVYELKKVGGGRVIGIVKGKKGGDGVVEVGDGVGGWGVSGVMVGVVFGRSGGMRGGVEGVGRGVWRVVGGAFFCGRVWGFVLWCRLKGVGWTRVAG